MRYVYVDGTYVPKHCIYGPRPREALYLEHWEWTNINDTLQKNQRERAAAEAYAAKEQKKKEISLEMTKNWQNTLAVIKKQNERKRREQMEQEKLEKIEEYNRIIKNQKEARIPIMEGARRQMLEGTDEVKTLLKAFKFCAILTERDGQVALKKQMKEEEKKREAAYAELVKKDVEAFWEEQKEERRKDLVRKAEYRKFMLDQLLEKEKASEEERLQEILDLQKMREALERLEACNKQKRVDDIRRTKKLYVKANQQLLLEKTRAIEDEEECVLNYMYNEYAKKYKKLRDEKEKSMIQGAIRKRMLEQRRDEREEEKEKAVVQEETGLKLEWDKSEEMKRQREEMEQWKADFDAKRQAEMRDRKEMYKWVIAEGSWKREVDRMRKEEFRRRDRERKRAVREQYDSQLREAEEARKAAKERDEKFIEKHKCQDKRAQEYCEELVQFVKENNFRQYPLLAAAASFRKICRRQPDEQEDEAKENKTNKPTETLGFNCYFLKD